MKHAWGFGGVVGLVLLAALPARAFVLLTDEVGGKLRHPRWAPGALPIPFVVNELTRNVNPIKLREYLAAGRAVVSTPLPEAARYAPHVATAGTAGEFVAACERAMAEDSAARRSARAAAVADEGWGRRVEEISRIVMSGGSRHDGIHVSGEPSCAAASAV